MSTLLISPDGMLGRAFASALADRGESFRGISFPEFDLTKPETVERQVRNCDVVINCSAYTDVDGAEEHEELATSINGRGVGTLADRCAEIGAKLVHFSTDYVFDGTATSPYAVDHPYSPVNAYGRGKAEGERRVRAASDAHLVLRTSWLYAPWAKNFVLTIAKLAKERDSLRVVNDQRGRPSSVKTVAASTLALLKKDASGTLHVCDGGDCTWFDFASAIAAEVNPSCTVDPCSSDEYPRPAKRPGYSVLDLDPTEALIGPMEDWRGPLMRTLAVQA